MTERPIVEVHFSDGEGGFIEVPKAVEAMKAACADFDKAQHGGWMDAHDRSWLKVLLDNAVPRESGGPMDWEGNGRRAAEVILGYRDPCTCDPPRADLPPAPGCPVHEHFAEPEVHPADWAAHGRAAGVIRNREMVKLGADLCLTFAMPDSIGTFDCARRTRTAGIHTIDHGASTASGSRVEKGRRR